MAESAEGEGVVGQPLNPPFAKGDFLVSPLSKREKIQSPPFEKGVGEIMHDFHISNVCATPASINGIVVLGHLEAASIAFKKFPKGPNLFSPPSIKYLSMMA